METEKTVRVFLKWNSILFPGFLQNFFSIFSVRTFNEGSQNEDWALTSGNLRDAQLDLRIF